MLFLQRKRNRADHRNKDNGSSFVRYMAASPRTPRPRFAEALRDAARFAQSMGVPRSRLTHGRDAASLVAETEADAELCVAALLHDVTEHQIDDERLDAVRSAFGERVARIVGWCADNGTHPLPPFRGLDEFRVAELWCATRDVVVVAVADTVAAVRDLTERLSRGPVDAVASPVTAGTTAWFLSELAQAAEGRLPNHTLAAALDDAVGSLCAALRTHAPLSAAS